jgi:hypothetical protein
MSTLTKEPKRTTEACCMSDHAACAAAEKRLDELQSELRALEAEGSRLDSHLRGRQTLSSKDADLAEILGRPAGDAKDLAEKAERREAVRVRAALLTRAIPLQEAAVQPFRRSAARKVLDAAGPEHHRLLAAHAETVVMAAKSLAKLQAFTDRIAEEVAAGSFNGLGFYGYRNPLDDGKESYSSVCLWLAELREIGAITGAEAWLAGIALPPPRPAAKPVPAPAARPALKPAAAQQMPAVAQQHYASEWRE